MQCIGQSGERIQTDGYVYSASVEKREEVKPGSYFY